MTAVNEIGPLVADTDPDDELVARVQALASATTRSRYESRGAIATLAEIFGLDATAAEVLAITIAADVNPEMGDTLRSVTGYDRPTVELAVAITGSWQFLGPAAALRRWRLLALTNGGVMTQRQLIADERIVNFAIGVNHLDPRLEGLARQIEPTRPRSPREEQLATDIADVWHSGGIERGVNLVGTDPAELREVGVAAIERLAQRALWVPSDVIPSDWTQRFGLATFLDREMALSNSVTVIDAGSAPDGVSGLVELMHGPVLVCSGFPLVTEGRRLARFELGPTQARERVDLWHGSLGTAMSKADIAPLAEQFALSRTDIDLVVDHATALARQPRSASDLWPLARERARGGLDELAERIDSSRGWDDLVLRDDAMAQLKALAAEVQLAATVRRDWGWAERSARGIGTAALFAGPSGTGKTLAAEVVANELELDLYRIDLSRVVSKWIGETEKNLAQIFGAAETSGAILLFDEADALFGKRTEVRDSHDRYANVEVSYLLQRMEAYRGLAILTTNLRSTIDRAFLRRIRHCVTFPFPDLEQRAALWARAFPPQTPTEALDPKALATLTLTGGSIHAVALNACFLAARESAPVRSEHLLIAARREFEKLEKPMSRAEIEALT